MDLKTKYQVKINELVSSLIDVRM